MRVNRGEGTVIGSSRPTHNESDRARSGLRRCFFFQAEDGIRGDLVTGVQTCALPIFQDGSDVPVAMPAIRYPPLGRLTMNVPFFRPEIDDGDIAAVLDVLRSGWLTTGPRRSEERRVGKERRAPSERSPLQDGTRDEGE